jgi:hypothetical protein
MANGFVFVSPGVKYREQDLTFVQRNVGVTTLGVVGEFPKGPAFEPIFIQDRGQLRTRFGDKNDEKFGGQPKYQANYVASGYLDESSQLYVTRVLGLSGYNAGKGWALTLSAGINLSTTGNSGSAVVTTGVSFTNNFYKGDSILTNGQTGVIFTGFTKITTTGFRGIVESYLVTSLSGGTGKLTSSKQAVTGTSYSAYEGMVLAIIRSRATEEDVEDGDPTLVFDCTTLTISANSTDDGTGDLFADFTLSAASSAGTELYTVSLDMNSRDFITNVIGDKPKGKNTKIYVEAIYPDLIKKIDAEGWGYGVKNSPVVLSNAVFTDYQEEFQTPETPWVVSELRGSSVSRLFRFISISDGNAANEEIKISITNINPATKEFDILVRDFNDTDDNIVLIESFRRCTMRKSLNNYIGKSIGTLNGDYSRRSQFISIEISPDAPEDAFAAGFEGYMFRDFGTGTTGVVGVKSPQLFYKESYLDTDRVNRVYLGISEKAYDTTTSRGTGFNRQYFKYYGAVTSGLVKTKGFHMDSGATGTYTDGEISIGQFEVGEGRLRTAADVARSSSPYNDILSRKFTLVPYGGFDGWDEHRLSRTNTDLYGIGQVFDGVPDGSTSATNDYQAWEAAIRTFNNPESITINVFTTPGINWSDNLGLVRETIDMVEQERADSLYIIDAPRLEGSDVRDVVELLDITGIDSNYSATFYPWVQIRDDVNNVNLFVPPTVEVVKSIAFTDNVKFPWYAPAGLQRGTTDALKADMILSLDQRDTLYAGRINPMATFQGTGVVIFGQKTLQVRESALDRINVRRLLLQLRVLISNISTRLVFEQNDQTTKDEFLSKVNPILDSVKRERGLQEFRVKMDNSNNSPEFEDRNELYGEISIKPTHSIEFVGLVFTLTPSGASFDNI